MNQANALNDWLRQARTLIRLAVPIILARAGWMFLSFVDILMVGRFGTNDLAYMSLASSIISVAYVAMMGMMQGTLVVTSNLIGEQRHGELGAVWRRSLPYAFALGVVILLLTLIVEPILLFAGLDPLLARESAQVIQIYGYGMPLGGLVYITSQYFMEALKRPLPAMLLMIAANFVNVLLNWLLIYGHWGFEAMGAAGSAWATSIIRVALTASLIAIIWYQADAEALGIRKPWRGGFAAWREQRRLGYAAGLSFGIEHVAFVMLFVFAGLLGTFDLAALTIVFNTFALFFMVALGLGSATAVEVGIGYGKRDTRYIRRAGWTGWLMTMLMLTLPAICMVSVPEIFARLYTDDPRVLALALPLYVLGGYALLLDTTQTIWSNALRGRHDKWFATASHMLSYVMVMVPLAWYLAFPLERRSPGLFEALIVASVLSVVLLTGRFVLLGRRDQII